MEKIIELKDVRICRDCKVEFVEKEHADWADTQEICPSCDSLEYDVGHLEAQIVTTLKY